MTDLFLALRLVLISRFVSSIRQYGYVFDSWQFPLVLALVRSRLRQTVCVALQGMVVLKRLQAKGTLQHARAKQQSATQLALTLLYFTLYV